MTPTMPNAGLQEIASERAAKRAEGSYPPAGSADYLTAAMDYIIDQTGWANHFPEQCHERIRLVCEAVKQGKPLPFQR